MNPEEIKTGKTYMKDDYDSTRTVLLIRPGKQKRDIMFVHYETNIGSKYVERLSKFVKWAKKEFHELPSHRCVQMKGMREKIRYDVLDKVWFMGGYFRTVIDYCPFCGEKLKEGEKK